MRLGAGSERRVAWTVTAAFAVAGASWVLFTDALLYAITHDATLVARLETAKGWTFVTLTALLIYAVTLRSASKLAKAQATIAAIVESIADGVLVLGPNRAIAYANSAASRMLGCNSPTELLGMGAAEFSRRFRTSYPDGRLVPPDRYVSQRVFVEGGPLHYKAILHPPGVPELIVSVTAAAVRIEAAEPPCLVVSVMHDITQAEHLARLRDNFLSSAAHALKTPVAIQKANAQLLGQSAQPDVRRAAEAIDRQCGRIDRLLQNMLLLARLRSNTLDLHSTELELAPLVESITREMARDTRKHGLRTELRATPRIHGDLERLATVLRNMIEEGFRNSKLGTSLTVLLGKRGHDAEIGFRYQPLPLEEQAAQSPDAIGELDIAQSVARSIVEAHGGALSRESTGSETTTWIRLPAIERPHGHA